MTDWQPYREPLRATLTRTIGIAIVAGAATSVAFGRPARWPMMTLLMLWPSFGGHWVEIWFLNWLRPRLSTTRGVQIAVRIAVWFVGGIGLAFGVWLTAFALTGLWRVPLAWWVAGFAFIGIELVAQLVLQMRGRPSFYNGRG